MVFNSLTYLVFLLVVSLLYFIFPSRLRWLWLLLCSYYFYMSWNARYAVLMLLSTGITYLSGILMVELPKKCARHGKNEHVQNMAKKWVVFFSMFINLGILFFFKYFNFLNGLTVSIFSFFGVQIPEVTLNVLLPVGISFYIFQALSYTMDVYRGTVEPQRSFGKYALFVSFFPQLVAGPIEQSQNLLPQVERDHKFDFNNVRSGLVDIAIGMFKKIVVADRLAILVNTVYNNPTQYEGFTLLIATIFFAVQIYCDFGGYSDIAIGSAKIFGFDLMVNFKRPYFSKSIAEFWRRWHISLSNWFKEYLYIPLGGNRVSISRKYLNVFIVFLLSGLWHGASLTFVVWGVLHGLYQILGNITKPARNRLYKKLQVDTNQYGFKLGQSLCTFGLACFAWIFFRANSMQDAVHIIRDLFRFNYWVLADDSLYALGLEMKDFYMGIISIALLFCMDWFSRGRDIKQSLFRQNLVFRWSVYICFVLFIVIFGSYGSGYSASEFIYFQF